MWMHVIDVSHRCKYNRTIQKENLTCCTKWVGSYPYCFVRQFCFLTHQNLCVSLQSCYSETPMTKIWAWAHP